MNRTASPLERWREIVHPLFWPVFFWNLRAFVRTLRALRTEHGEAGELAYGVTWWGGIVIERIYSEPKAAWDVALEGCARRVHVATLDVLNPHLTRLPLPPGGGARGRGTGLSWLRAFSMEALLSLTPSFAEIHFMDFRALGPSPAGEGDAFGRRRRIELALGAFPNLPFLNTS